MAFTMIGMPFIGAIVGSAISTFTNGGNFANFATGLGIGLVSGFVGGTLAGGIANFTGMNLAGIETAFLRGGLAGAIGGMGSAAAYGGNIWEGAWQGAAGGMAVGGLVWGRNALRTNDFIKNHVKLGSYTAEQKAAVLQSIKESGQSPVGGRMMSRFIRSGSTLNLGPESSCIYHAGAGPHVDTGTNNMFFDGNVQDRLGSYIAKEPWGPSLNDGTVFTHELSHTPSGYSLSDPLNVAHSENLYRGWVGAPARNDYGVLSQGGASEPVQNRSAWDGLTLTW